MLEAEALWFRAALDSLDPHEVYPLANIGSSTGAFRTEVQPFIDALLFAPARAAGHSVVHVDIKAAPGVDAVGDLTDPADAPRLVAQLREAGVRAALCSNLLEHVVDRRAFCDRILDLLPPGGLLLLSVPFRYPHHPDPIDTGYRPSPEQLHADFPGTDVVHSEVLDCGNLLDNRAFLEVPKKLLWVLMPWYKPRLWLANLSFIAHTRRPFLATCLVLRKRVRPLSGR